MLAFCWAGICDIRLTQGDKSRRRMCGLLDKVRDHGLVDISDITPQSDTMASSKDGAFL